jgi:PAS domain S-box-containing protein
MTVDGVIITPELDRRARRAPNYAAENRWLTALAAAMTESPRNVFQKLADAALELCRAGSAGVSVWDRVDGSDVFRWYATAGEYAAYLGETLPRRFSPCGTVVDRNATLLMADPARCFPYIQQLCAPVREVLLVPFHQAGAAIGTVWVVAHESDVQFDAEDVRVVTSLTQFAAAAINNLNRIEDLKEAQRAQDVQQGHYQAVTTATTDVVFRMSADWSALLAMDGREFLVSNSEPITDWIERHLPSFEQERVLAAVREAVAGKRPFELECRVNCLDGSLGWTFSRAIPVCDANGAIVEWFGVASDITRRKQAEAELADIRSRMEAALDVGMIGTWSWDIQADRFYGDASLARIFAVPPSAVAGGPLAGLLPSIHPDDCARVQDEVTRAVAVGGRYECDYRVVRPDGSWRWVTARGQVECDAAGRAMRFPGVVIDITARKRAEEALARLTEDSERRKRLYEAVLSGTPDFVYVFGLDYRFQYVNQALLEMWGRTAQDSIGKSLIEIGYEPWHAALHEREIDQVRDTKQPIRGEVPFKGTLGRRIYDYIFVPVFGADGEVEAVAGTTRDVTERKQMEDEVRESDRKKDDFIALLAHELRNPLAPIRNALQILQMAGGDSAAADNARAIMERQLGHMVRLIDDLLDVSRISRNKMELRRERVQLADVVAAATEAVSPLVQAAGHTLNVVLPTVPVFLDADLTRLAQVFGNLLTNSIKYTPPGGKIELRAEREGSEIVVCVADDGIGIPQEFLPQIFEMFSQVDRSVERATGGLGIGLALVKGLVEMHGGTITAASAGSGRGSSFTVRLPMHTGAAPVRPPVENALPGGKFRVLVVDDNRDGALTLAMMLRLLGNDVATAHDGLEALATAEAMRPDVVLMDVGMPKMNGLEATRQIKASTWGRNMIVIALTGWGQEGDRCASSEAGCDGHLVKPVEVTELQQMLVALKGTPPGRATRRGETFKDTIA